jgi:hypothetical protein
MYVRPKIILSNSRDNIIMTSILDYILDWEYDPPDPDICYNFCIYTDEKTPHFTFSGKIGYYHTKIMKPEECCDIRCVGNSNDLPYSIYEINMEILNEEKSHIDYRIRLYVSLDHSKIYHITYANKKQPPSCHIMDVDRWKFLDITLEPDTDHIMCAMKNAAAAS